MKDTFEETTPTQSEQLHTSTDEVRMSTKKVGCILVTSHLKQFLEDYPSSSEKQVFLDIYHMLSLLDKYLYDHPKQHINKPYIDNIDAYNRDRQLITASLSNRLDLGQNSLQGAQQVRVAVKHSDQTSEFLEHHRQISLGEEIENISQTIADGNVSLIPQVDGIVDSRDSLDRTPDSIDLTESPEKNTRTQKHVEKTNEDISDNDTDEMITYETDELKKSNRKNVNSAMRKGRMAKIYTMNIDRKRLLKQRRERTLQNTKGKGPAEEYFLTALKDSSKSYKASKNSHKRKKDNNGQINDDNTNIAMTVYDINNLEIVGNHEVNATTNAKNTDTESANIDNINTAETEIDKNDDIAKSDNDDNPIMSDKESPLESPADDNIENDEVGENSTDEVHSPLIYDRKTDDPAKVKSSKRHRPVKVMPLESPTCNPQNTKIKIKMKMPQVHQILMYLILMMYKYMHSSWKENQKVKN